MYTLTLTAEDRQAIDWVGNRYRHGDELFALLWADSEQCLEDADWDSEDDITFQIPEHVAWDIQDIINDEDGLACFAPSLIDKLFLFCEQVV